MLIDYAAILDRCLKLEELVLSALPAAVLRTNGVDIVAADDRACLAR